MSRTLISNITKDIQLCNNQKNVIKVVKKKKTCLSPLKCLIVCDIKQWLEDVKSLGCLERKNQDSSG